MDESLLTLLTNRREDIIYNIQQGITNGIDRLVDDEITRMAEYATIDIMRQIIDGISDLYLTCGLISLKFSVINVFPL